jgi:hypothetical protein
MRARLSARMASFDSGERGVIGSCSLKPLVGREIDRTGLAVIDE